MVEAGVGVLKIHTLLEHIWNMEHSCEDEAIFPVSTIIRHQAVHRRLLEIISGLRQLGYSRSSRSASSRV
jgi:hypothetical protein